MYTNNFFLAASFVLSVSCRPAPQGLATSSALPASSLVAPVSSVPPTTIAPPVGSSPAAIIISAASVASAVAPVKRAASSAAGSLTNSSSTAPAATSAAASSSGKATAGSTSYTQFSGDGSTEAGWPSHDKWVSFDDAFNANQGVMQASCASSGQANDSPDEISDITLAVNSVASSTGVDARFIFAVIMQESSGCVRVKTTANAVQNSGLMQSFGGTSCFGINPCPTDKITQMVQDGAGGVGGKSGLEQGLASALAGATAQKTYQAARIYNSGSLGSGSDLAAGAATPCYSSDVANRLIGFVGTSTCTLNG